MVISPWRPQCLFWFVLYFVKIQRKRFCLKGNQLLIGFKSGINVRNIFLPKIIDPSFWLRFLWGFKMIVSIQHFYLSQIVLYFTLLGALQVHFDHWQNFFELLDSKHRFLDWDFWDKSRVARNKSKCKAWSLPTLQYI